MIFGDRMVIDPAYRETLQRLGLARVQDVLERVEGRVVAWSRTTDTLYVPDPHGGLGVYLKRYFYPRWTSRLRGAARGTFFGSHRGEAEWRLLNSMRNLGIPAVRPVAYGARRTAHFVTACFLVTEEVPGARNLTAFAQDLTAGRTKLTREQRTRMISALARQIAEVHAAGFEHGQLFWRNFLVRLGPTGDPEFFFLDARPRRGRRWLGRRARWWLDELAHVAASAMSFTTRAERLRFLREYFGAERLTPEIRWYARLIDRLAARWERHERQRIKMSHLFEEWNRQLESELARFDSSSDGLDRRLAGSPASLSAAGGGR